MASMSMKKRLFIFGIGFMLGCGILFVLPRPNRDREPHPWHAQTAPDGYYPLVATDAHGREVRFERQPRHFISLAPSITEIVFALGMGDHLMAVSEHCDYPEGARAIAATGAVIGSVDRPNVELILQYAPDLVLAWNHTAVTTLEQLHRPPRIVAMALAHRTLDEVLSDIATVARVTGVPSFGIRLLQRLRAELAEVDERIPQTEEPRPVLLLPGFEQNLTPGFTPGKDSWVGQLITRANARNVGAGPGVAYRVPSFESILADPPDVILLQNGRTEAERAARQREIAELPSHRLWGRLEAVQAGRIVLIEPDPLSIPGPRVTQAYRDIAMAIWPEAFADMEAGEVARD